MKDYESINSIHELQERIEEYKEEIPEIIPVDGVSLLESALWNEIIGLRKTEAAKDNCLQLLRILRESGIEHGDYGRIAGRDLIQESNNIMHKYSTNLHTRDIRNKEMKEVTDVF